MCVRCKHQHLMFVIQLYCPDVFSKCYIPTKVEPYSLKCNERVIIKQEYKTKFSVIVKIIQIT